MGADSDRAGQQQGQQADQAVASREHHLEAILEAYRMLPLLAPLAAESPFVPPYGPMLAPLMMIGEAPGREETEKLRPFVGNAGKVLRRLMTEAGVPSQMTYFTNVVKFRPPGNRTPYPFEIAASRACLFDEIRLIEPALIITLGSVALRALDPEIKLAQMQGKRFCWKHPQDAPYAVLPLYHPALTFHDPKAESAILAGLLSITGSG